MEYSNILSEGSQKSQCRIRHKKQGHFYANLQKKIKCIKWYLKNSMASMYKEEKNVQDTTSATHNTDLKPLVLVPSKTRAAVHVLD